MDQNSVFKYSVDSINKRRDILRNTDLVYDIMTVIENDSFDTNKKACKLLKDGVAAIFGPMSHLSASHVHAICETLEVPHIETRINFQETPNEYSVNLHPHFHTLGQAYIDIIKYLAWKKFTLIYQHSEGLLRLADLLKLPETGIVITVRRLETSEEGDYRHLLKEIQKRGDTRIIVDCDFDVVNDLLQQAQSINMITEYFHYHFTSLDISLVNLDNFKYSGTNITAFRLVDPNNTKVISIMDEWRTIQENTGMSPLANERGFSTQTALTYDAIHLFAKALEEVSKAQDVTTTSLSCARSRSWTYGSSLLNYMKMTQIDGLTGRVKYDSQGLRTQFTLDFLKLTLQEGLKKIGTWNKTMGLYIKPEPEKEKDETADQLRNKTLIVTTIAEPPYIMVKDPNLVGNDRYEGFCVDLLDAIAKINGFNYTIKEVDDGNYGAPTGKNGEWNGMVREIIDKKADLVVASLTISYAREQVIDFTKPFMNLGISILFKKPEKQKPELFSFLSPLSFDIWLCMIVAYIVVSLLLCLLARVSPYEWDNPHPCNPDSDMVENQFTFLNSLWFTIGSLMQQGSDVAPRAISTRIVGGIWWFFTLIIISSYTANLAAFLTVERMSSPIDNADDLAKQTKIKYGPTNSGSTMSFFKDSKIPVYEKMWSFMNNDAEASFSKNSKEGIARVIEGNYAFLMESTMIEYNVARNCDLMQVGSLLDSKGYGVGTPRGSPYRDMISNAILKLQEDQKLQMFYNKWWKEKGTKNCDAEAAGSDASALAIDNVGGVFVLLLGGMGLALIVAILEYIWKARKNDEPDRKPLWIEIWQEFKFAARCCGSSKRPVKKKFVPVPPSPMVEYHPDGKRLLYNAVIESKNGKNDINGKNGYTIGFDNLLRESRA